MSTLIPGRRIWSVAAALALAFVTFSQNGLAQG